MGNAVSISATVAARLNQMAAKMSKTVEVGFLEDATYPDGTPVAAVAYWNEYGASGPPRPFFRNMIAAESPSWPKKLAGALKATENDGTKALKLMGEDIQGALIKSINDLTSPALAESTIKAKGFDKPLIDSGHMVNSTGSRVVE